MKDGKYVNEKGEEVDVDVVTTYDAGFTIRIENDENGKISQTIVGDKGYTQKYLKQVTTYTDKNGKEVSEEDAAIKTVYDEGLVIRVTAEGQKVQQGSYTQTYLKTVATKDAVYLEGSVLRVKFEDGKEVIDYSGVKSAKLWTNASVDGEAALVYLEEVTDDKGKVIGYKAYYSKDDGETFEEYKGTNTYSTDSGEKNRNGLVLDANYKILGIDDPQNTLYLYFDYSSDKGYGSIKSDGFITKTGTLPDGTEIEARIAFDSEKGGLYLLNEEEITKVMNIDEYIYEYGIYSYETLRMSQFNTYEDYLQYHAYSWGVYDEETGLQTLDEDTVKEYIEDKKSGKNGEHYENMTYDEFLQSRGLMTRDQFDTAKENKQEFAIYYDEEMRSYTDKLSLSDITFTDSFLSDSREGSLSPTETGEYSYNILGSSIGVNGLSINARMTLADGETIGMTGSVEIPGGEGGENSKEARGIVTEVTAEIDGENIKLSGKGAQFDITFNGETTDKGYFTPQFDQFIAGTRLTLTPNSHINSTNKNLQSLSNSSVDAGTLLEQDINLTTDAEENTVVVLKTDTKLCNLAGKLLETNLESGSISVDATYKFNPATKSEIEKGKINDKLTETLHIIGTIDIGKNWKSTNDKHFYLNCTTEDILNKRVSEIANDTSVFGGKFKDGNIDMGGFLNWNGTIKLNNDISNISIHKNAFVRTLETVGGFVLSVVGVAADPGGLVAGLMSGIVSAIKGEGFGAGWNKYFSQNAILNMSASLMLDKSYADVVAAGDAGKAAIMGFVAVAAIVVTVVTGGAGLAAFIPALAAFAAPAPQ